MAPFRKERREGGGERERERERGERERESCRRGKRRLVACLGREIIFSRQCKRRKRKKLNKNSPSLFVPCQIMRLLLGARLKKTKKMRGISGDHDDDDDDDWKSGDGEVRSFFLCFCVSTGREIIQSNVAWSSRSKFQSKAPALPLLNSTGYIASISLCSSMDQKYIRSLISRSRSRNARVKKSQSERNIGSFFSRFFLSHSFQPQLQPELLKSDIRGRRARLRSPLESPGGRSCCFVCRCQEARRRKGQQQQRSSSSSSSCPSSSSSSFASAATSSARVPAARPLLRAAASRVCESRTCRIRC